MKKILKVLAIVAVVIFAGYNVHKAQQPIVLSDVAMANVEALAQTETDGDIYCPYEGLGCVITYTNGTAVTYWGKWPKEEIKKE